MLRVPAQRSRARRCGRRASRCWSCVGPGEHGEKLVRSAARLAAQLDVPWHAVYVETPALPALAPSGAQRMLRTLKLAHELGATPRRWPARTLATALVRYAREHNLSRVVLGRDTRRRSAGGGRRWPKRWRALGPDLDVVQIALPPQREARSASSRPQRRRRPAHRLARLRHERRRSAPPPALLADAAARRASSWPTS